MGWRVPVLAQTLNTHFLIIVEYYCLIVQGYEEGGVWLIPFHAVLCTAESCLIEMCLMHSPTFDVYSPQLDKTFVVLAVQTCGLKYISPGDSHKLSVFLMACWHWNRTDNQFSLSSDRKATHVWVLACDCEGNAIKSRKHQSDLSLHWKVAQVLKMDQFSLILL